METLKGEAAQRQQIVRAGVQSFAYFGRSFYTIRDKQGKLIRLRLNHVQTQIEQIEAQELKRQGFAHLYILKARQGGVSTHQQARNLHLVWSKHGVAAMTFANSDDQTAKIFEVTHRAIENFPAEFLPTIADASAKEITFPKMDSRFWTGTAGSKRSGGRAITLWRFHGSEFALWTEPRSVLNAVMPAVEGPGRVIVLETTASAFDSEPHTFWREAQARQNTFRAVFFPWWLCDPQLYRRALLQPDELGALEPDEQDLIKAHGLDLEQIKWRREKLANMGRAEFLREYAEDAESCWLTAGYTFYDVEVLRSLMTQTPTPKQEFMNGALKIFNDVPAGEVVVIGCDTAEGVGGDRSAFTARSWPSWKLIATFADSRIEPQQLADVLAEWGRRWGTAYLIVEKNSHGITVLRDLRYRHKYPIRGIYHRTRPDDPYDDPVDRMGWLTSSESIPLMLDAGRELFHAAKAGHAGVPSIECLRDAFAVQRDNFGRVRLSGRDVLVSEQLAWLARPMMARRQMDSLRPLHF